MNAWVELGDSLGAALGEILHERRMDRGADHDMPRGGSDAVDPACRAATLVEADVHAVEPEQVELEPVRTLRERRRSVGRAPIDGMANLLLSLFSHSQVGWQGREPSGLGPAPQAPPVRCPDDSGLPT